MNVCLVRPPVLINKKAFSMNSTPPLGLAFIAAALKKNHHIHVVDAIAENPTQFNAIDLRLNIVRQYDTESLVTNGLSTEEIIQRIPPQSDVIGFSCMFSNNWLSDRVLIDAVGKAFPNATIIAGGESISAAPELWMSQAPELDICVIGEGEETIVDLCAALAAKNQLLDVGGIAFRNEKGEIIQTPRRERVKELEEIIRPAWEFFPLENYDKYKIKWSLTDRKSLPILATRGCPYTCTFCSSPQMWGTKYYMREPKDVADEIEYLINTYGVTNFDFYDLTAIIRRRWILEFCQEVLNRKLDITWQIPAGTRSEAIDDEVARSLNLSGCTSITYAPESGSDRMLKLIKKKVNLEKMLRSIEYSSKEGQHVFINMIFALPEETHKDLWKTIWFIIRCSRRGLSEVGTAIFQPYPGSELFAKLVAEKKINLETDDFFVNSLLIAGMGDCDSFNDKVSIRWYKFYIYFTLLVFYISNYIFWPGRFFVMCKNMITQNYATRTERALGKLIISKMNQLTEKLRFKKPELKNELP